MNYDELFGDMLDFMEFSLIKEEDGFALLDYTGVNLGDIEGERFDSAKAIVDRMETYIRDYMLDDDLDENGEGSYSSVEEAMKQKPDHALMPYFDLIANHLGEVNLSNVCA